MPKQDGVFPAVILISGSGPQNRDEELMGHKPFLVLSDYLTKTELPFYVMMTEELQLQKATLKPLQLLILPLTLKPELNF